MADSVYEIPIHAIYNSTEGTVNPKRGIQATAKRGALSIIYHKSSRCHYLVPYKLHQSLFSDSLNEGVTIELVQDK